MTFTNLEVSINEDEFSFTAEDSKVRIKDQKINSFVKNISIVFNNNEFKISQGEAGGESVLDIKKFLPIFQDFIPDFHVDEGELVVKGTSSSAFLSISSDNQMKTVVEDIDLSYKFLGFEVFMKIPKYEINFQSNKVEGEFHGINIGLHQGELYYVDWVETSKTIKFKTDFLGSLDMIEGEDVYEAVKKLLDPVVQKLAPEESVFVSH